MVMQTDIMVLPDSRKRDLFHRVTRCWVTKKEGLLMLRIMLMNVCVCTCACVCVYMSILMFL